MAKILIIDDEEIIRQQMQKLLTLDDYETFTAEDGPKGLEIYDREQPEIVLVDVKMPGMDGIEVLKRIKERCATTEVINITGHGGVETAIRALKLGAFGYIQKPVEYDELEIEIRRALEKQEMQKQLDRYVKSLENAYSELEQIFNTAADGMWVIDKDHNVLRVNERLCALSGVDAKDAVGKKCYDIFPGSLCGTSDCDMTRILDGEERLEYEIEKQRQDGSNIPCLVTAVPYVASSGELIGMVQNIKDITARKQTAREINEAHHQLESLYQQLQREHEITKQVFANVIRTDYIEFPHMKYLLCPMEIVGGDLILAASGVSGSQFVFLGDFTGHGLSAAIGAISVSDIFYTMVRKGHSIAKMVDEINRKLKSVLPTGLFLCACIIELDLSRGILTIWNGGLPDVLVVADGSIKRRLPSAHLPLGVLSNDKLDTSLEVVKVARGDRIYVYTDGVIEATNADGEMFGQERLEDCFTHPRKPDNLFDEVGSSLDTFRSGSEQRDDIAMIEIQCDPEAVRNFNDRALSKLKEVSKGYRLTIELGSDDLRSEDLLPRLLEILVGGRSALHDHRQNIYLILSELFANALDYGVLGLDSKLKKDMEGYPVYFAAREKALSEMKNGWIKLDFTLSAKDKGGELIMRVEDSGSGFDYSSTLPQLFEDTSFSGRGILLVKSLCKGFSYQGRGNQVEAIYAWS